VARHLADDLKNVRCQTVIIISGYIPYWVVADKVVINCILSCCNELKECVFHFAVALRLLCHINAIIQVKAVKNRTLIFSGTSPLNRWGSWQTCSRKWLASRKGAAPKNNFHRLTWVSTNKIHWSMWELQSYCNIHNSESVMCGSLHVYHY